MLKNILEVVRLCAVVLVGLIVTTLSISPVSATTTLPAGMLPAGTFPLQVFDTGESSNYRLATDPDPSVVVTNTGGSIGSGGWQRQQYHLAPGEIEWTLLAANDPPVEPIGTYLSDLGFEGIYFTPQFPVKWRQASVGGVVLPDTPWSWTITSSNGGVVLSQTSVAHQPSTEMDENDSPIVLQRIDTTMTFSGTASGTLTMTHVEEIGVAARANEHFEGTVSLFGSPTTMNRTVVLGGLGGLPGSD